MTLPITGAGRSGAGDIALYFLQAPFTGDNQGYSDAQVLDTAVEGVALGQLTVVEVDGTLALVSNKCALTAQATPVWTDLGLVGELLGGGAFTKALGLGLLGTINLSTWEEMGLGWHSAAAMVDPDTMLFALQANTTDGQLDVEGGTQVHQSLSVSTDYRLTLLCGGFDVNGTPYYSGQAKANYTYGAWYLLEIGGTQNLLWLNKADNTASIYAILSSLDAVGTIDDIVVPIADLSAVQAAITNFSSFDDDNDTSLDAITPEVGGAWTELAGDWDIQSNRATCATGVGMATVDAGVSNAIIDCIINRNTASWGGLMLRVQDSTNFWLIQYDHDHMGTGTYVLYSVILGSYTARATLQRAITASTDYRLTVVLDGDDITFYVDGTGRTTFNSSFNNAKTVHGIYGGSTAGVQVDNYMIAPRAAAIYDTTLDAV